MIRIEIKPTATYIPGVLFVDDAQECYTLDWPLSGAKFAGVPPGKYEVFPFHSPHFKRVVLRFVAVPGRVAIEIHMGNTLEDSEGCILVGAERSPDGSHLYRSVAALDALLKKITGKTALEIVED